MLDFSNIYLKDLAGLHDYYGQRAVKKYCDNTEGIAGEMLEKAGVNLTEWKGKILPANLVIFLRKINPTWEDLQNQELQKIRYSQLFPNKFKEELEASSIQE
jgi:hypothetical protein